MQFLSSSFLSFLLFFFYRGKSYGGHDDVQTVFGQAILVAEFSLARPIEAQMARLINCNTLGSSDGNTLLGSSDRSTDGSFV